MSESFGIVEAARRAREWSPELDSYGQRLVLAGLVVHMRADSKSNPTVGTDANASKGTEGNPGQLMLFTGLTARAIRRVLTELTEKGVIAPLSDRSPGGKNRPTEWTIKPGPGSPGYTRTGKSGLGESVIPNPDPGARKPGPWKDETRTGKSGAEIPEISEGDLDHSKPVREVVAELAAKYSGEAS